MLKLDDMKSTSESNYKLYLINKYYRDWHWIDIIWNLVHILRRFIVV